MMLILHEKVIYMKSKIREFNFISKNVAYLKFSCFVLSVFKEDVAWAELKEYMFLLRNIETVWKCALIKAGALAPAKV